MKVMNINSNNQQPQFKAKLENTPALTDFVKKLYRGSRDDFYRLMEVPETIKKIRDIKIDGVEPLMSLGYSPDNGNLNNTDFTLHILHDGIRSSIDLSPERKNPKDFLDYLCFSMQSVAEKLQDSEEYINKKLKPIIDKING